MKQKSWQPSFYESWMQLLISALRIRGRTTGLVEAWLFLGEELERQDQLYRRNGWDRTELERDMKLYHEWSSAWEADEEDEGNPSGRTGEND